jgi:cysteine-rich secretory family protein
MRARIVLGLLLAWTITFVPAHAQQTNKVDTFVDLINRARVRAGVLPVARSPELDTAAQSHSVDMVENDYLDHIGADGSDPQERADAAGYHVPPNSAWIVVEVISAISGDPQGPVDWLLNDAQHRRVLLNPRWREIGAGYAQGGEYGNYWTADFGCRPGVLPTVVLDGVTYTHTEQCGDPSTAAAIVAATPAEPTPTLAAPTPTVSVPTPTVAPPAASLPAPAAPLAAPAVTVAGGAAQRGNMLSVQWRGMQPSSASDWIGLYQPGDGDATPIVWTYVGCLQTPLDARRLGACNVYMPNWLAPSTYEFRLFRDNGYQRVAVSSLVQVN